MLDEREEDGVGRTPATSVPATDDEQLRRYLAERDAPCPGCGYNLRGLAGPRCPECDAPLALRVGLAEPRLGAFLCGAIGLGAGIGFSGLLLGYFLFILLLDRPWGPGWSEGVPLAVSLAILGALLSVWIRTRAWQRRAWSPRAHWIIAGGAWLLSVASAVWFFAVVA
jgi:hypothetical protein